MEPSRVSVPRAEPVELSCLVVVMLAAAAFLMLTMGCAATEVGVIDVETVVAKIEAADTNKDGALSIAEVADFLRELRRLGRPR